MLGKAASLLDYTEHEVFSEIEKSDLDKTLDELIQEGFEKKQELKYKPQPVPIISNRTFPEKEIRNRKRQNRTFKSNGTNAQKRRCQRRLFEEPFEYQTLDD